MYINNPIESGNYETGDYYYDSLKSKQKKVCKEVKTIYIDIDKIDNACVLYKHNIPILFEITLDNEVIEGYPSSLDKDEGYFILVYNNTFRKIQLADIRDYKILKL